ncbi:hypothetical protein EaACW_1676 [Erwinia amylovora ACW56400]|uniref:Uncharacterized protein n=2 Tax=Erwinia amylovora TaxID=552 RepID=A0A831EQM8_ERWAM|nr:hypothetical protein EaACW_1676 [Erwinia amylovora ACW56400]CBX80540.1 hypothetical protein predicted by Glimmer/Critica [Erwinia amylovora ATCC BAA-2158]CCO78522.1 hypothetical protein BN432_1721 [Erwinia amylovora Ea356]CCO82315.1 hypothetical protein BN433_1742 [Erwinia amylovora Ea266]CCO86103.1 hypothetical protein BN434_1712 [Erwinia amylovora CFBP 2585]CCO89893.1 hypothetical protein BN435_1719 [Erwinia amylovora 01SFR-BO]CCO93649.1 hypothetical protein BN437_1716 [Erwinia amylovora
MTAVKRHSIGKYYGLSPSRYHLPAFIQNKNFIFYYDDFFIFFF